MLQEVYLINHAVAEHGVQELGKVILEIRFDMMNEQMSPFGCKGVPKILQ